MGVAGFIAALNERNLRYVVLRWFDTLPSVAPGEDIDILVHDDDAEAAAALLIKGRAGTPCDIYSVSGIPGYAYQSMAYFPPPLARGILANAVRTRAGVAVPAPADHFSSLAYHAVYHKGFRSGIRSSHTPRQPSGETMPDHDYLAVLQRLAKATKRECGTTLEALDRQLTGLGWRPPNDMLARLAIKNEWIRTAFFSAPLQASAHLHGLAVFIFRRIVIEQRAEEELLDVLKQSGFEIIMTRQLDQEKIHDATLQIRGGNWNRGPWPQPGGVPAMAVLVRDQAPLPVPEKLKEQHPLLDNLRTYEVKLKLRDTFNRRLKRSQRCNCVHSSDNCLQACEYLEILAPETKKQFCAPGAPAR